VTFLLTDKKIKKKTERLATVWKYNKDFFKMFFTLKYHMNFSLIHFIYDKNYFKTCFNIIADYFKI
jgi:hypothetical protein